MGTARRPQQRLIQSREADPELQNSNIRRREDAEAEYNALAATPEDKGNFVNMKPDEAERLAKRRRAELAASAPTDAADIAIRDLSTGRARRTRGNSTATALGTFSPSKPLGADSALGRY